MHRRANKLTLLVLGLLALGWLILGLPPAAAAPERAQAPTATPAGQRIEVFEDVTVRAGPGAEYDRVGTLIPGQTSTVLGRSSDNRWVQIVYLGGPNNTGWVWVQYVRVIGELPSFPTVAAPPTPTLPPTPTPDVFVVAGTPSPGPGEAGRLPTFTPPAPEVRPTLLPAQGVRSTVAFPPAVLIIILFVLGTLGGLLSLVRQR